MRHPGQVFGTKGLALLVRDRSDKHAAADHQRERSKHGHHAITRGQVHKSGRARDGINRGGRHAQATAQVLKRAVYALANVLGPKSRLLQDTTLIRKAQTLQKYAKSQSIF